MYKVYHLIPYYGIGGVETAAQTMTRISDGGVEFCVQSIFSTGTAKNTWVTICPLSFFPALLRVWRAAPQLLIVSLWRSCIVGVLLKVFRPSMRLVLLLHYPNDVHILDRFFTRLAARLSCRVWADSHETLEQRLPKLQVAQSDVISFVTSRVEALPIKAVQPTFVFWGRIHMQKGLPRALHIFAAVHAQVPEARFFVIGPDGGELAHLRVIASSLDLGDSVQFLGPMDFAGIRRVAAEASFYLQTSELEGMAMSVVEAMQLGLVPVVAPVGEIAHYARHRENAIFVMDDSAAVGDVLALLIDDARYAVMRQGAVATWVNRPLYKDSMLAACREALGIDKETAAT